jgi:hypothetical protein
MQGPAERQVQLPPVHREWSGKRHVGAQPGLLPGANMTDRQRRVTVILMGQCAGHECSPALTCGFLLGPSPALLAFAADVGALAALGGQDVGVAGVGVAASAGSPAAAGQPGVVGRLDPPMTKVRQRTELAGGEAPARNRLVTSRSSPASPPCPDHGTLTTSGSAGTRPPTGARTAAAAPARSGPAGNCRQAAMRPACADSSA